MPKNANPNPPTGDKPDSQGTITAKIAQLDTAVEWFYGDEFTLDEALARYQSAIKLAEDIKQDLAELKNQVEVLEDFTKS